MNEPTPDDTDIVCESCGIRFQVITPAGYVDVVRHCPFCGQSELKEDEARLG